VKENKRFENSKSIQMLSTWNSSRIVQTNSESRKKSKRTFDGREREKERMRKKVEEIHVEEVNYFLGLVLGHQFVFLGLRFFFLGSRSFGYLGQVFQNFCYLGSQFLVNINHERNYKNPTISLLNNFKCCITCSSSSSSSSGTSSSSTSTETTLSVCNSNSFDICSVVFG
jgi:hypothetical protein